MADSLRKKISNFFSEGMSKDTSEVSQPKNSYRDAWNVVEETDEIGGIERFSENSNELCAELPEGYIAVGARLVEERDHLYIFSYNVTDDLGEIGYIDLKRCEYVRVLNDNDITADCSLCFNNTSWIENIEIKIVQPCSQLHLYWSHNDTYYRFKVDDKILPITDCDDLKLFVCRCAPSTELTVLDRGGDLPAAAYLAYPRLRDEDGNVTNWFAPSSVVYLGDENCSGENSNNSIRVELNGLPKGFTQVEIAMVSVKDGVTSDPVPIVTREYYTQGSGVEFIYRSEDQVVGETTLAEIVIKNKGYIRGGGLKQFGRRLLLFNVRGERNIDYQERVSNIKAKYKVGRVPISEAHNFRGLRHDEVYSFSIGLNYCDGRKTRGFPLVNNTSAIAEEETSCIDCQTFDNTAIREGDRVEDNYNRPLVKDDDQYVEYVPTDQGILTSDDAPIPDIDKIRDAFNNAGGDGDDCDCAVFDGVNVTRLKRILFKVINPGGLQFPTESHRYHAVQLMKELCRCFPDLFEIEVASSNADSFEDCITEIIWSAPATLAEKQIIYSTFLALLWGEPTNAQIRDYLQGLAIPQNAVDSCFDILGGVEYVDSDDPFTGGGDGENNINAYIQPPTSTPHSRGYVEHNRNTPVTDLNGVVVQNLGAGEDPEDTQENDDLCKDDSDCESCEYCDNLGVCQSSCDSLETCCIDDICSEPQCDDDNDCVDGEEFCDGCKCQPIPDTNKPYSEDDVSRGGDIDDYGGTGPGVGHDNETTTQTVNNGTNGGGHGVGVGLRTEVGDCEPTIIYEDEECCTIKKVIPCIDSEGEFSYWESCETYPETTKCCDEGLVYGELAGQPIRHFKTPSVDIEPHFISYQDGVPTSVNKDNDVEANTYARFIWPEFYDIELPTSDELDTPLCPVSPYTIYIQKRTGSNKSIIASGVLLNTFEGDIYDESYAFPKLGVNSVETVDRFVEKVEGDTYCRIGNQHTTPIYTMHSPDTHFDRPSLDVDTINIELPIEGRGFRHGLYNEGIEPQNTFLEEKCNHKGARAHINLNHFGRTEFTKETRCVLGASYVPADSVVKRGDKFSKGIVNLQRESTVAIETDGEVVLKTDTSFIGDVCQHQRYLYGEALYGTLKKENPSQYGNLISASYYPYGHGKAGEDSVFIMDGDSFINYFHVKRTSYVSDRVGADIKPRHEYGGGIFDWKIVGNLLKKLFSTVGAGEECGSVPQSGSLLDPRSLNGHNGLRGTNANCELPQTLGPPDRDTYFPAVQTTLVSFPVESDVNLYHRCSGESPNSAIYRDTGGLEVDSSFVGGNGEGENTPWLDIYTGEMKENPRWKMLLGVIINILFTYGIGVWLIVKGATMLVIPTSDAQVGLSTSILTIVSFALGILILVTGIVWIIHWVNTDLDNRFWNNILGIKSCFPDKRQRGTTCDGRDGIYSMYDKNIKGFMDNYFKYSYHFSYTNEIDVTLGLPDPYNLCECLGDKTHEILYSNAQNPLSPIDAYRNFKTNNYLEFPADTGKIVKMFSRGDNLFAHTTDSIWTMRSANSVLELDKNATVFLGNGDFLQTPVNIFEGPEEGYAGLIDANSAVNSAWGYIFIDREARKVYLFSGGKLEEIGTVGVRNFLKENLGLTLCEHFPNFKLVDKKSPDGVGYSIGIDNRHNRLIITQSDYEPIVEGIETNGYTFTYDGAAISIHDPKYFCNKSFTLSYSFLSNKWVSFHSYTPTNYMWDRKDLYSLEGNGIWKHNRKGHFLEFYGESFPMSIDYVVKDNETFGSFSYISTKIDNDIHNYNDCYYAWNRGTFDAIIAWNNHQNTGELNIEVIKGGGETIFENLEKKFDDNIITAHFDLQKYYINGIKDKVIDYTEPIWECNCEISPRQPNLNNLDASKTVDSIKDNHLCQRLIYRGNDRMTLRSVYTDIDMEST